MKERLVSTSFFDIFIEYLRSNDHDAPDIQDAIASIKKQYPHRAPEKCLISIFRMIEADFPKPALCFRIGLCAEAKHYGVVGYMATTCATLQQALMRCIPYQNVFSDTMDARLVDEGNQVKMKWWGDKPGITRFECETGLAAFVNFYQLLIGKHIPPVCIELPFEPAADPQIYEAIIGCPVHFNAECVSITLHRSTLLQDISSSDPYLRSLYERQAKALLDEELADDDFLHKTRIAIQAQLYDGDSSAEAVAEKLGLSLRTFYRQLSQLGLRYRSLLGDTRLSLARTYLADSALSLAEIALMLGYSDQSAFTRAFTSWTGKTPSRYRETELT